MIKLRLLFFLIIAALTIPILIPDILADTTIQRGPDYELIDKGNSQFTLNSGLPEYIPDYSIGQYVPFITFDNGTHHVLEAAQTPYIFNKASCEFNIMDKSERWPGALGPEPEYFSTGEKWRIAYRENNTAAWQYEDPITCNTSTITNGTGFYLNTIQDLSFGQLNVTYATLNGEPVEVLTWFKHNNTALDNYNFAFVEIIKNIKTETLRILDTTINQDGQYNITTPYNSAAHVPLIVIENSGLDPFVYSFANAADNYGSATIDVNNMKSDLTVYYTGSLITLEAGEVMFQDPTFGYDPESYLATARTSSAPGTACPGGPYSLFTTFAEIGRFEELATGYCERAAIEWDISPIPTQAVITDVRYRFDNDLIFGTGRSCDFYSIEAQPSSHSNASALYEDAKNGTAFVTDNSLCTTTGIDRILDLGPGAVNDIQNNLLFGPASSNTSWWAVGLSLNDETREIDNRPLQEFLPTENELQVDFVSPFVVATIIPSFHSASTGATAGSSCPAFTSLGSFDQVLTPRSSSPPFGCAKFAVEFDISTIPVTSTVTNVSLSYRTQVLSVGRTCEWNNMETQPSTHGTAAALATDIEDGLEFLGSDSNCVTGPAFAQHEIFGNNNDVITTVQTQILDGWFGVGVSHLVESRTSTTFRNDIDTISLIVNYTIADGLPDAVTDLTASDITASTVDLSWTEPDLNGGQLTDGYQINNTTPFGNPLTVLVSDTGSSLTSFEVSGLTPTTDYSFRVSAINQLGLNASGNIVNITTLAGFVEENFTVGTIEQIEETNIENIIPIRFERIDVTPLLLNLNVTYDEDFDLACEFGFKFSQEELFFNNLTSSPAELAGEVESQFSFVNVTNDVIAVRCFDQLTNDTEAFYVITITNFPLLQQIQDFRAGEFGTDGMFGVLDFITLMVVIISMIGFNRVNESAGAIFNVILIGALAFFEIITFPTIIFAAMAVMIMLIITSTRKV